MGAVAVEYPAPPDVVRDTGDVPGGSRHSRRHHRARRCRAQPGASPMQRFPDDRRGRLSHALAMKTSDSAWHRTLSDLARERPAERQPVLAVAVRAAPHVLPVSGRRLSDGGGRNRPLPGARLYDASSWIFRLPRRIWKPPRSSSAWPRRRGRRAGAGTMIPLYISGCFACCIPAGGRRGALICGPLSDEALNCLPPAGRSSPSRLAARGSADAAPVLLRHRRFRRRGRRAGPLRPVARQHPGRRRLAARAMRCQAVTLIGHRVGASLAARAACDMRCRGFAGAAGARSAAGSSCTS